MSNIPKILLTGASGWFGRSFISEYIQTFGLPALQNITLVTSDGRPIRHPLVTGQLPTITLNDAKNKSSYHSIIQASFLTKDKISKIGTQNYSLACMKIIEEINRIVQMNPKSRVFVISSGAVYNDKSLYGEYKRLEEYTLKSLRSRNLAIFRVFGATTRFMDYRNWSAICNFVKAFYDKKDIHIRSEQEVCRGLVCMEDLSKLIIEMIKSSDNSFEDNIVCDAVSDIVTIRQIAELCVNPQNKVLVPEKYDFGKFDGTYTGDPNLFTDLANVLEVRLKMHPEQIQNAIHNEYPASYS